MSIIYLATSATFARDAVSIVALLTAAGHEVTLPNFTIGAMIGDLLSSVADDFAAVEAADVVAFLPSARHSPDLVYAGVVRHPVVELSPVTVAALTALAPFGRLDEDYAHTLRACWDRRAELSTADVIDVVALAVAA
jgi:hypothetical protein